jgi:competence protein ComFB
MEVHNVVEDLVFAQVDEICDAIEKEPNNDICTCRQCRMDTTCYVLNRYPPRYVASNRGVARVERESIERQQKEADIVTLIYEGLHQVSHNQRPNFNHHAKTGDHDQSVNTPVYNIPTIIGRLFNGLNFAPMADINVELRHNGNLVPMKDGNWQNPYRIVMNTEGTFTFWPDAVPAESADTHSSFEYTLLIDVPGFEPLSHHFTVPVISEYQSAHSFSMGRTFKLRDLFMFPPEEEEMDILA